MARLNRRISQLLDLTLRHYVHRTRSSLQLAAFDSEQVHLRAQDNVGHDFKG